MNFFSQLPLAMIKAVYADKPFIIDILCRAFENNNCVNEVVKPGKNRLKKIRNIMEYSFDICWNYGEIYFTPDHKAVALVFFPDRKKVTLSTVWNDVKLLVRAIDHRKVLKVITREFQLRHYYPEHLAYLWYLGVDPDCQGQGVGSALLKDLIALEDQHETPIYLETSTLLNVSFYKRMHFKVFKRFHSSYTLFMLKHEPQKVDVYQANPKTQFQRNKVVYNQTA